MIKTVLHKSSSVLLAFLVLCSTLSITIESHFCGDTLIDVAVFTEAQKCETEFIENALAEITKKSCCKDDVIVVKGQDDLQKASHYDFEFSPYVAYAFIYAFSKRFEVNTKQTFPHEYYKPPKLVVDIQLFDQVFLI